MEVMIYGNGESRKQFDKLRFMGNYTTWGCNAIYRDLNVDNLVSVDYAMQQEIECSGYAKDNVCLLYTSPSPRDLSTSRMPSSA